MHVELEDTEHLVVDTIFSSIPKTNQEVIKIWDFQMPSNLVSVAEYMQGNLQQEYGRVRILAVFPKKPNPLENIKFSIAWCNPLDTKNFTKKKSNQILVGRFLKAFVDNIPGYNTGIVSKINVIKEFPEAALNTLKFIPLWVDGLPPNWDYLESKKISPDKKPRFGQVTAQV
jgi:hypothetical protein